MRLHHLSITAFGPFADAATVDFDALSTSGLFLLTGATGAGKTSVLDAVCFALYGQVPGDRAGAKHLRSDHAGPQLAPEVVLRLSIGERQFTFTRSPAWMRPKLRGTGETKVQAHVLVEELQSGSWTVLTNRLDDAGLLVTELLGMSCTQFTQVAMLPQGRFQAFLRASSSERHAVLQQLFRTDRFERIEQWLVERRHQARRASETAGETVLETINRLQEAAGTDPEVNPHLNPTLTADLAAAAESGSLERWVEQITATAAVEETTAAAASTSADLALARATKALRAAERTEALRLLGEHARDDLARWEKLETELKTHRVRLDGHRRAAPLIELARSCTAAASAAARAESRWLGRRSSLTGLLPDLPPEELTRPALSAVRQQLHDAHAVAVAFAPRAASGRAAQDRLVALQSRLQLTEAGIAELELTLAAQPGVISDAVAAVHEARAAAARHPLILASVQRLEGLVQASRRAELVGLELAVARTDVLAATETAQLAKEHYLDLREARINGMAGELAGQLASGCSCPVCGSASHPSPARPELQAVGRDEEDHARRLLDDAAFEVQARQVGLASLEGELASLEEQLAGIERTALAAELEEARDTIERLEPLVAALDVLAGREASCRAELHQAEQQYRAALLERAELQTESDQLREQVVTIATEWEAVRKRGGVPGEDANLDLSTLIRVRAAAVQTVDAALVDFDAWSATTDQANELTAHLAAAAREAGFDDPEAATAAVLPDAERDRLEAEISEAGFATHAARLTLADPAVAAALAEDAPDLSELEAAASAAQEDSRRAVAHRSAAAGRRERLAALAAQFDARLSTWAPLRDQYREVAALSSFVEGKSQDNPRRMRLAAYVLSERLRQVVEAANERLAGMTDQRYALEHTDDRGYGEQRGGLSLRVRDDWNGVHRDPATLSGGETFVVSLALALGLADTVAHEAGGTDIDTLFIDEGFGSLDADTLEDVMDTLDSLRDGGRVVGLVSHVPELRSRITTQLEVTKGRSGSTLRAAVSSG